LGAKGGGSGGCDRAWLLAVLTGRQQFDRESEDQHCGERGGGTDAEVAPLKAGNVDDGDNGTMRLQRGVDRIRRASVDGRSPDTIDAANPAQAPVVTATRSPGFQWGDFGIGAAAALTATLMLAFTIYLLAARRNRKQPNPVATA